MIQKHIILNIAKYNNKIKTTQNIMKKQTGEVNSVEQLLTLLVNDEKLKDLTNMQKPSTISL